MKQGSLITYRNRKNSSIWKVLEITKTGELIAQVIKCHPCNREKLGETKIISRPENFVEISYFKNFTSKILDFSLVIENETF